MKKSKALFFCLKQNEYKEWTPPVGKRYYLLFLSTRRGTQAHLKVHHYEKEDEEEEKVRRKGSAVGVERNACAEAGGTIECALGGAILLNVALDTDAARA